MAQEHFHSSNDPSSSLEEVFRALYAENASAIYNYLSLFLGNRTQAEDLTQEVFMRAYRQLVNRQDKESVSRPWLFSVARNLAIDWQRKSANRLEYPSEPEIMHGVEDISVAVVDKLEMEEFVQLVQKGLYRLNEKERSVFLLRVSQELKFKEVASIMGFSERNAKRLMKKALRKIIAYLEEEGITGEDSYPS